MNMNMNNEILYSMLLESIRNMNDEEMKNSLEKAKTMLSEADYLKLTQIVAKERNQ